MSLGNPAFYPLWPPVAVAINPERRWVAPPLQDAEFLVELETYLRRIDGTRVGKLLLHEFHPGGGALITPGRNAEPDNWGKNDGSRPNAAFTVAVDLAASTAKDEPIRYRSGAGALAGRVRGNWERRRGLGTGCPSIIYFDLDRCNGAPYHMGADGVLVHELVHALENAHGASRSRQGPRRLPIPIWARRRTPRSVPGYPTDSEFLAQVVLDMYLLELGRRPLVGYSALPGYRRQPGRLHGPRSADADAFERKVRLIEQNQMRGIFRRAPLTFRHVLDRFAGLPLPYNPFRDVDDPNETVYVPHTLR